MERGMLHRFLFVAGMTVGVMTPLVWATYVARPTPQAVATNEFAASIPSAIPVAPETAEITPLQPSTIPQAITPANRAPSITKVARVARPHRAPDRYLPAVIDSYNGAHIITICAALTVDEQLGAGCP